MFFKVTNDAEDETILL